MSRFRWVSCQLDYILDLPTNADRRKALDNLPPTLDASYERILTRINEANPRKREMIRRCLVWIFACPIDMAVPAICQAISIEDDCERHDAEAELDEEDILRYCTSLVRSSPRSPNFLQAAHVSVKEFLYNIDTNRRPDLAFFKLDLATAETEMLRSSLRFINYLDFDNDVEQNLSQIQHGAFPFYDMAVELLYTLRGRLDEGEALLQIQQLFDESRERNFTTWTARSLYRLAGIRGTFWEDDLVRSHLNQLQVAVLHDMPQVVEWLLSHGADPNEHTLLGTSLHCSILGVRSLYALCDRIHGYVEKPNIDAWGVMVINGRSLDRFALPSVRVLELLLSAGSDTNVTYWRGKARISPLILSWDTDLRRTLIAQGAKLCAGEFNKLLDLHKSQALEADPLVELTEANINQIDVPMFMKALYCRTRCRSSKPAAIIDTRKSRRPKKPVPSTTPARMKFLQRVVEDDDWELYTACMKKWSIDSQRLRWSCGCTPLLTALANGCERTSMNMIYSGTILTGYTCNAEKWPNCSPLHFLMGNERLLCCLHHFPPSHIRQQSLSQSQVLEPIHLAVATRNHYGLRHLLTLYSPSNEGLAVHRRNDDLSALVNARTGHIIGDSNSLCNEILGQPMPLATPLHIASFGGDLTAASMLLEYGAYVDPLDEIGQTPFLIATNEGHVDMMEFLLLAGCDIYARDEGGRSAVHLAAANGPAGLEVLRFLHIKGIDLDLNDELGETCLSVAAAAGRLETIMFILDAGCDIMHTDDIGYTPLMHMLDSSDEKIRELALSANGSKFDAYNSQTGSVFHRRWVDRDLSLMHSIVHQLAPAQVQSLINKVSVKNGTPLYNAVVGGQVQSVEALAGLGADLDLDGGRFGSPLMAAVEYGRSDIFKLLVRRGAKVELGPCTLYARSDRTRGGIWRYPNMLRWLLVEQYTDQHKLTWRPCSDSDTEKERILYRNAAAHGTDAHRHFNIVGGYCEKF